MNIQEPAIEGAAIEPAVTTTAPAAEPAPAPSAFDNLKAHAKASKAQGDAAPKAIKDETLGAAPVGATSSAYQPKLFKQDWKFNAFNKEYQLDEKLRKFVTDADSELQIKDLVTKAHALDDAKARYESTAGEYQNLSGEFQALDKDVKRVMKFRNDGDYDNFFSSLRIPKDEIYEWVRQDLAKANLPPEQQRAMQMQTQERQRLYDTELEKGNLQTQFENQAVQMRTMQLDISLGKPQNSQIANAWDERAGREGAFRDLVIKEAQIAYHTAGEDLSPDEVIGRIMQTYGGWLKPEAAAPQAPQAIPQTIGVQTKPVIPTVAGKGTSPIKKVPRSIEDLKALYKEKQSQENNY